MVNSTVTSKPKPSHNASYDSCPSQTTEEQHEPSGYDGTLLWDAHLQGLMFSATSFGSFLILVPAGILADKFSARIIAFIGVSLAGLATYALPFIAQHFTYGFIGLRFIIGGSLGMIIPALASIASRWFVPDERATLSAIYTSGAQISGIFLGLVAPYLCSLKEIGGWVSVYYLCAFLALVWGFLWLVFASNYAEKNRSISDGEKLYITNNVIPRKGRKSGIFPWKSAFTSLPFISILVVRVTGLIQHQILQYYAATFIRDVLHTDIYRNGLFIALPHLTDLIPKMLFSTLADLLKRRKITGYTASVRLFQSIGCFGSACCFAGLVFLADCNRVIPAVALLGLSGVFASFVSPGANTSALSIAPMYTGTIHSIDMLIGFLLASGSVYLTGIVIHKGFIIPSFTAIASRWFVPNERSTLNAIHTSGVQLSGVFLGLVTPPLCSLKELGGWASVYYLCSTLTITWAVLWLCFSSNFPDQHRSISDDEINYISENMIVKKGQKKGIFPWRAAFMSTPFLAVLLARTTLVTQHQIMTFYTTSFIRDVLKSDLKSNGLFTTLPYIASFIAKIGVSGFADHLKQRKVLSYNTSTRLFQTTGNFGIALCFAILAVVADCNHVFLSVSLLVLQAAFTTFVSPGMHTSALSIAPLHAGGLHSVSMFIANLVSSAAPTFVGSILVHVIV
ncbi:hypothetical protein QR680_015854 [Steinernema hermaphroditum]|uniref:Major facilitator superfamily (MFS) profile domain-containing protein n=1 Tax=Steinernema hermaphroditum TaxID=289476 RepID=A0AA39HA52_9BILA|nr:hypothetical protein QR680_015854 [Steinernema hermaphroditum]